MAYRFATDRADRSDLASGTVLRSAPGHPGYPVRLAEELLGRVLSHLPERRPAGLWDPCCGSGHLAASLGLLHRAELAHVLAGDADPDAVGIARRNLALLAPGGLAERERELLAAGAGTGRGSFAERAAAARRLAAVLEAGGGPLPAEARVEDAFRPGSPPRPVDAVITDVPYGGLARWHGAPPGADPVHALLTAVAGVLPDHAVLAVSARARKVALPAGVAALERVRVGNRAAVLVRAADLRPAAER
ncbi:hypothetical protein [Nocardiopsis potens]|uniref:hypothetical protein n=1 Tax=Nocardiopsis potens TaxID=1246458 RepID=UPI00034A5550|nr:hypothetical protein [Nocardiopsis potens]